MDGRDRSGPTDTTSLMEGLDRLGVGYYRSDADGRITAVNGAGAAIYGYTPEEMLAGVTTLDTNVSPQERDRLTDLLRREGNATRFAVPGRHKSGRPLFVSASIHTLRDGEGRVTGYEGVFTDSTAQVEMERQRAEALEELRRTSDQMAQLAGFQERFLSVLSHDLQTPPVVIQGVSELLLRGHYGALQEPQDKAVRTVHRNVLQLSQMMEQLLQFSRLINDRDRGTLEPIPLRECVEKALAGVRGEWQSSYIRGELEKSGEPLPVEADPPTLDFLVRNLLLNAGAFTQPGFSVRCRTEGRDGRAILQVVAEPSKPSLPKASRLLQKFFLLPSKGEEDHSGSMPIGLAAGSYLARLLMGDLAVEPSRESGVVLTLTLPLAGEGEPSSSPQAPPMAAEKARRERTGSETAAKGRPARRR